MGQLQVGLLGGSFNPPHVGHVQISCEVLKRLGLDQIWWLVSPQNPLKSSDQTLPLDERVALCRKLVQHPRIKIVDLEKKLPDHYSITTVRYLLAAFPNIRFIWIIGADNLLEWHKWRQWKALFALLPILVYERGSIRYRALASRAAQYFKRSRLPYRQLSNASLPAWSFMIYRKNSLSSTTLREGSYLRLDKTHD